MLLCCFQFAEINWRILLGSLRHSYLSEGRNVWNFFSFSFGHCCGLIIQIAWQWLPSSLLTQEDCFPTISPPMMTHPVLNSRLFITSHQPSSPAPLFISPDLLYTYSAVHKNLYSNTFSIASTLFSRI